MTEQSRHSSQGQSQRSTQSNPQENSALGSPSKTQCPECDGNLLEEGSTELVCQDCSLVVSKAIGNSTENNTYQFGGAERLAQTGKAVSPEINESISTSFNVEGGIGESGYESDLSDSQLQRIRRLKDKDRRKFTHEERTVFTSIQQIRGIAASLDVPERVTNAALVTFQQAYDEVTINAPDRSLDSLVSASLYAGARREDFPQLLSDLAEASLATEREIMVTYTAVEKELSLPIEPESPQIYVPHLVSTLECSLEVEQYAKAVLRFIQDEAPTYQSGLSVTGLAAGATYFATRLSDTPEYPAQTAVADAADISPTTLQQRYQFMSKKVREAGKQAVDQYRPNLSHQ